MVRAALRAGAQFSLVMTRNAAIQRAIDAIGEDGWTSVKYPGAVRDADTGNWISDAEVAEIAYTAFASTKDKVTARLIVRRVKDARYPDDALFPVWRYHPFFTNGQARAATLRRKIVNIPARLAHSSDRSCTCSATGLGSHGSCCGTTRLVTYRHNLPPSDQPGLNRLERDSRGNAG